MSSNHSKQTAHHDQLLRAWYLARLRKRALAEAYGATNLTPGALIKADNQPLADYIADRSSQHTVSVPRPQSFLWSQQHIISAASIAVLCYLIAGYFVARNETAAVAVFFVIGIVSTTCLVLAALQHLNRCKAMHNVLAALPNISDRKELAAGPHKPTCEDDLAKILIELVTTRDRETLIVDYSQEAACVLDSAYNFVSVSPASNHVWGYSPPNFIGKNLLSMVSETERYKVTACLEQGMRNGEEFVFETAMLCGNKGAVDTEWVACWSSSQQVFFAAASDVTEKKNIERLKSEFLAVLSHDLQSPISSVGLNLKVIAEGIYGSLSEKGNKRLTDALEALDHLQSVIADLLEVHSLDTVGPKYAFVPSDSEDLLLQAVRTVKPLAEDKHITIRVSSKAIKLNVDPVRIRRVLINLLSNAIKFSPNDSTIAVSLKDASTSVSFTITDEAGGIAEDVQKNLFERYTGHGIARRDGSGLGLYASKAIVEAHQGSIQLDCTSNTGSTFTVTLPKNLKAGSLEQELVR